MNSTMSSSFIFLLLIFTVLLSGCFPKDEDSEKMELAKRYWDSLAKNDPIELNKYISVTLKDSRTRTQGIMPQILRVSDDGVIVKFSRYCYDDFEVVTHINKINNVFKVNHKQTALGLFKTVMDLKTNKEFCYPFSDKPFELKTADFDEENLIFTKMDFLGQSDHQIISRNCEVRIDCPKIMIFNLVRGYTQGNLGDDVSATLYIPPNKNIFGVGSFKITTVDENTKRLDLVFKDETDNQIDMRGFINFNADVISKN